MNTVQWDDSLGYKTDCQCPYCVRIREMASKRKPGRKSSGFKRTARVEKDAD